MTSWIRVGHSRWIQQRLGNPIETGSQPFSFVDESPFFVVEPIGQVSPLQRASYAQSPLTVYMTGIPTVSKNLPMIEPVDLTFGREKSPANVILESKINPVESVINTNIQVGKPMGFYLSHIESILASSKMSPKRRVRSYEPKATEQKSRNIFKNVASIVALASLWSPYADASEEVPIVLSSEVPEDYRRTYQDILNLRNPFFMQNGSVKRSAPRSGLYKDIFNTPNQYVYYPQLQENPYNDVVVRYDRMM